MATDLLSVDEEFVEFSHTYSGPAFPEPRTSHSRLRFVNRPVLDRLLAEAGFRIVERYGNWDRSPCTATSPEIITVAEQADGSR
jgi:hypothetical protein